MPEPSSNGHDATRPLAAYAGEAVPSAMTDPKSSSVSHSLLLLAFRAPLPVISRVQKMNGRSGRVLPRDVSSRPRSETRRLGGEDSHRGSLREVRLGASRSAEPGHSVAWHVGELSGHDQEATAPAGGLEAHLPGAGGGLHHGPHRAAAPAAPPQVREHLPTILERSLLPGRRGATSGRGRPKRRSPQEP